MDTRYAKLRELAALQAAQSASDQDAAPSLRGAASIAETRGQSGPTSAPEEVSTRLGAAVRAAAVSGRFDPNELFGKAENEELRLAVLSQLSRLCTMPALSQSQWLLSSEVREEVLRNAKMSGVSRLLEPPLPSTDVFGTALRAGLSNGSAARISTSDRSETLEALAAIQFLRNVGLPAPDPGPLDAEVARENFLAEYRPLLSGGFFGRSKELRQLEQFVRVEHAASGHWSALVLSGLGGAGKSTLIARFLSKAAKTDLATIAVLDFDRPGVDIAETSLLTFEVVRQVGYQRPELEPALAEIRDAARTRRNDFGLDPSSQYSLDRELVGLLTNGLGATLRSHGIEGKPLLLVLDTMEEVVIGQQLEKLIGWLDDLKIYLEGIELKVVFSGRLNGAYGGDDDLRDLPRPIKSREPVYLLLGELSRQSAEALLRARAVERQDAKALLDQDLVPRRPLELMLLARLLTENSGTHAKQVIDDLRNNGELAKGLFAGLVYRRVLLRISDPIIRKLASPGLVLRYIDPDLVKEVLVPVLGLEIADAQVVTDALASYAWLSSKHPDGTVWHRRDLRQSMLKAMMAENPIEARAINVKAAEYFERREGEAARAEFLYHRLMLARTPNDVARFSAKEIKQFAPRFAADIVDLPLVAQVYVRYAQGQSIRSEDVHLLPSPYRDQAIEQAGDRLVRSREYDKAAALLISDSSREFRSTQAASRQMPRWSVEALFATMNWHELTESSDLFRRGRIRSVQELAELLIPRELIRSLPLSAEELDEDLDMDRIEPRVLSSRDGDSYSGSAALGLALVEERDRIGMKAVKLASILTRVTEVSEGSLGLGPRELLLVGLGTVDGWVRVALRPAHLRLDKRWLEGFRHELSDRDQWSGAELIDQISIALDDALSEEYPSMRRLLTTIDAAEKGRKGVRSEFLFSSRSWNPKVALEYLRGPDPELRDPLRYALADCAVELGEHVLAEILNTVMQRTFRETRPEQFVRSLQENAPKALELPVEMVDRMGKRQALLAEIRRRRPISAMFAALEESYRRLDQAVLTVFSRFG
jgi:AAA ATPase domain